MRAAALLAFVLLALLGSALFAQDDGTAERRRLLVEELEATGRLAGRVTGVAPFDPALLAAIDTVPRHRFVPPQIAEFAYDDRPLPLGHGQNLTQPFLMALMTQALELKPGERVFETGTDTGYQAAILAELGVDVFSVEIVEPLFRVAERLLREHGKGRVRLRLGDGFEGWPAHAPYDAMLIKESAREPPPPLLQQLKPGGRMVIPLGPADGEQHLTLIRKEADGTLRARRLMPVRFAPFQGGERT
jgi:protein-L-isoaspartate(D-aspartate) O-methyltransferase